MAMPRLEPFAGLRYDPARVDMGAVVSPPYDVIADRERQLLAHRHSANSVRVELPEPDQRLGLDRYANAAHLLETWTADDLLRRDARPSLYVYRMTTPAGRTTTGVIGALRLPSSDGAAGGGDGGAAAGDPGATDGVLPHEQTMPKPKSDRLDLLRATRANLSPIWGLSLTPGLTDTLVVGGPPAASATDDDGVRHELWVVDEPAAVARITEVVAASPLVLADGHHRFETALAYRTEQAIAGASPAADAGPGGGPDDGRPDDGRPDDGGCAAVMALGVELAEDQLAVGPVHRVLSGLPDGLDLVDAFSSWFTATRAGDLDDRTAAALGESGALALVMPSGAWMLSPRDGTPEAAGADLDSSMVALVLAELPEHELTFATSWEDAVAPVAAEDAQAAVLLRPATVEQIASWARARRRMPAKTTYFFPKPRTGMVFRPIDR